MRVRKPAVAGYFYESGREELLQQIDWAVKHELGPKALQMPKLGGEALGGVAPHAGYMYSGPVAAWLYSALAGYGKPDVFVIVGPNHYGIGAPVAIMKSGVWETPLGRVEVDRELAEVITSHFKEVEDDFYAFSKEHSVEVQVPFIQYYFGDVKIVPIVMWRQTLSTSRELGRAIAKALKEYGRKAYVIASSDFNHYEPHDITTRKDEMAISKILKLDEAGLFEISSKFDISICGIGPIGVLIAAAKELGYTNVTLLKHATSGDTSGYKDETVGYASILFYR
ncbi:AmmeMemoRadiSam system protein B [Pyrobaculum aerophilum]|uniref:MEMO1 family protein CGL51_03225 n=1 Tax=Pyrobaculum aerophilum TaxID=13773 RepID=A0A371R1N2_9CREN|nr:AmmeMemoRadiSam system protein B [Pyrobaculum aerophilum]RFA97465.1 AmmeMemoRadiSam system protein B [Pyrobaculum aerophilum]